MKNISWVNFLKLRASFGIINADYLPKDGDDTVLDYWDQIYSTTGTMYHFGDNHNSDLGTTEISRLATLNSTHEKAFKYNVGIDATLFKGLTEEYLSQLIYQKVIWVSSAECWYRR